MSKKRKIIVGLMWLGISALASLTLVSASTGKVVSTVADQSSITFRSKDQVSRAVASLEDVTPPPGKQTEAANAQQQSNDNQIEVEVITVRPSGFEPREITRRAGVFILAITNQTGATELALHLDRVQGNRVQEVRLPKGKVRWNKIFDLPSGDYVLSEQNHPDWICRIKLTAR